MRGKELTHATLQTSNRITPAYAGKRPVPSTNVMIFEDHPRLCGEKPIYQHRSPEYLGSPPPMRGKVPPRHCCFMSSRITPAYAGKRLRGRRSDAAVRDHPRLCGEKAYKKLAKSRKKGSPPPMRGKAVSHIWVCQRGGITPAYAGKSTHPTYTAHAKGGSPPPMRGKANISI